MLDTIPQLDIVTSLERIIFEIKPEVLYCHYDADMNSDHRIVSQAAMVWCRPSKTPFLKKVLFYEIFASTQMFNPNYYVDISHEIEDKLLALSVYSTENNAQQEPWIPADWLQDIGERRSIRPMRKHFTYTGK